MKKDDSKLALYRKYRPTKFSEVLGQSHITDVLSGSIKLGKFSHAYLFAGSRGTGKTSVARIFARDIGTSKNDTYEIDAASNTGVDDIRTLNESVHVFPLESKHKVYIIDEVHMLSKSAFNALLKTLEEPPEHVIFVLATTEIEKLPETVISRCQTFTFRRPNQKILKDWITDMAKEEGYKLEDSSADLIALLGDGSFRDTAGILQKVISSSKDKIVSVEEVEKATGAPKQELINKFIEALNKKDADSALALLAKSSQQNIEARVFLKLVLRKVRFILLLRHAPKISSLIESEITEADSKLLKKYSEDKLSNINSESLFDLLDAYEKMNYAVQAEIPLELAIIKICSEKSSGQ